MQNIALLRPAEEETSALVLRPLLPRLPLSGSRRQSQSNMAAPGRYRGPRSGGFAQTILPRSNITLHSNSPGSPELPNFTQDTRRRISRRPKSGSRTTTMRHSIESESCGETDELQRYRRSADRLEEAYKKSESSRTLRHDRAAGWPIPLSARASAIYVSAATMRAHTNTTTASRQVEFPSG